MADVCSKCGAKPNKFGKCLVCEMFESGSTPGGLQTTGWPLKSLALAVNPRQVDAANDRAKRHGLTGVAYQSDGECVISDRGQRKKLLKLEALHDNSGGYGD